MSDAILFSGVPTIDPEGVATDSDLLKGVGWKCDEIGENYCTWTRANGVVHLRAAISQDNFHRLLWEISIFTPGADSSYTQVGYSKITLRPGDLSQKILSALIKDAVKTGEAEINKLTDALAEARRQIEAA